eukprot:SAG22_NODE_3667_length_1584_cov_4.039731_2_plen_69_part_00
MHVTAEPVALAPHSPHVNSIIVPQPLANGEFCAENVLEPGATSAVDDAIVDDIVSTAAGGGRGGGGAW